MSNVLEHTTQQQILALGRLGWTLSRIEATIGVRREASSGYLKAARIPVRGRGRPREGTAKPAISASEVSTDSGPEQPAENGVMSADPAKVYAIVLSTLQVVPGANRADSCSAVERFRAAAPPNRIR